MENRNGHGITQNAERKSEARPSQPATKRTGKGQGGKKGGGVRVRFNPKIKGQKKKRKGRVLSVKIRRVQIMGERERERERDE